MSWLWLLACAGPAPFDPRAGAEARDWDALQQAWEAWQEAIEAEREDNDVPSIAAGVVIDGEVVWTIATGTRIAGAANLPVTTETVYRWGSVAKMHTALAVLGLADDGVLSLEDPLGEHFPDFALAEGDADEVTVDRLLTHRSALPDELDWSCDTDADALGAYYASWRPPLYGEPGAHYNYSNSGFNLLGAAVEQVTDTDFATWMNQRWLEPMGMRTATYLAEEVDSAHRATGHAERSEGIREYSLVGYDCAVSRPAAWLHGSVEDLARSAAFFLEEGDGLLPAATITAMADQADTHLWPDGSWRVGRGQYAWPWGAHTVVQHAGTVTGFTSEWAIVPDAGLGLVLVANAEWADVDALLEAGLAAFLGPEDFPPDFTTDARTWDRYAGTFEDPYVWGRVEVTWFGDRLLARFLTLDHEVELEQLAGDAFVFEDPEGTRQLVRFVFENEGDARPKWFVNRTGVATRVP